MGSRCLYSSLGLELADRREKLIPSSCDSISGLLTVARHQVSATEGRARRVAFKGTVQKALWTKTQACTRRQEYSVLLHSLQRSFKDIINFGVGNSRA